ncbi:MAG: ABC transporter permease [Gemmatimonadaceae bacterium]|nr:ABC transporter permease [Gemmatimonadaceae bacterium]
MESVLAPFLEAAVRTATPLAFAALGELLAERSGVINLGLEGTIIAGCLGAAVAASSGGVALGFVGAAAAGLAMALLFALFVVHWRTDQIITGTAFTLLGLGVTGTVHRMWPSIAGEGLSLPTLAPQPLGPLAQLPLVGPALFRQPLPTYALYLLIPTIAFWMARSHAGLALRAVGEAPEAARSAGVSVRKVRWAALAASGVLGGLCGATLVLAQVGAFTEGMSAGRGFIAIAIVVLGRWTVWGTAAAAAVFGAAFALQYLAQSLGLGLPYQIFLALPYVLTLVLLAAMRGRSRAPEHLAR